MCLISVCVFRDIKHTHTQTFTPLSRTPHESKHNILMANIQCHRDSRSSHVPCLKKKSRAGEKNHKQWKTGKKKLGFFFPESFDGRREQAKKKSTTPHRRFFLIPNMNSQIWKRLIHSWRTCNFIMFSRMPFNSGDTGRGLNRMHWSKYLYYFTFPFSKKQKKKKNQSWFFWFYGFFWLVWCPPLPPKMSKSGVCAGLLLCGGCVCVCVWKLFFGYKKKKCAERCDQQTKKKLGGRLGGCGGGERGGEEGRAKACGHKKM